MRPKPLAVGPEGEDSMSTILELVALFYALFGEERHKLFGNNLHWL